MDLKEQVISSLTELDDIKRFGIRDNDYNAILFNLNLINMTVDPKFKTQKLCAQHAHHAWTLYGDGISPLHLTECITHLENLVTAINKGE